MKDRNLYEPPLFDVNEEFKHRMPQLFHELQEAKRRVLSGESKEEFVSTPYSHEYPFLLKLWLLKNKGGVKRKILNLLKGVRVNEEKNKIITQTLRHEYSHAVPLLQYHQKQIRINYGLQISMVDGSLSVHPLISWEKKHWDWDNENFYEFLGAWFSSSVNPHYYGENLSDADIFSAAGILETCSLQKEMMDAVLPIYHDLPEEIKAKIEVQRKIIREQKII